MREDNETRNILNTIRNIQEGSFKNKEILKEDKGESDEKAIAITDDPKFGQKVLTNQIQQFKASVDSGAQFARPSDTVSDCPLIYMPKTHNLIFSGTIPRLNNLSFQFKLRTNTGEGCFIWADGLILSDENLKTIQKLYGFYKNWVNQWESDFGDLEMLDTMVKD